MYKMKNKIEENDLDIVIRLSDNAYIPCDPANSDYQRYLRWLENPEAEENGTIS